MLVSELEGLLDIGSTAQVNSVLREILGHPQLEAEAFGAALRAIGMSEKPQKWRSAFEAGYERMPGSERKLAGRHMLAFYFAISDSTAALPYTKERYLQTTQDAMFAMDALLDAGSIDEAGRLAKRLERMAAEQQFEELDAACLIEALASYHAQIQNWEQALALRSQQPRDQIGVPDVAISLAELHLASALGAIESELRRIQALKAAPDRDRNLALSLPGIEDDLFAQTQKRLSRMKRSIELVLPKQRRLAFGFDVTSM